jgi:ligand-binding sensor domain-containing protein
MRLPSLRDRRVLIAGSATLLCLIAALWLYTRAVDRDRERAADLDLILVEEDALVPPDAAGVALWLPNEAPRDVEPFGGRVYAATAAGLAVYDESGRLVRRYTTLDGLPENALLCLERFRDRLYVGTEHGGLVAFDGERFTRYRFVRPEAARVSALCATDAELLVGTFEQGVFEFDGAAFTRRFQADAGPDCRRVTALVEDGPRRYVGTYDAGLFEWREGSVRRLRTGDGLPSDRVTGVAVRAGAVVVATDLGVVELSQDGRPTPVDPTPNVAGLAVRAGDVWVASPSRGVARLGGAGLSTVAVAATAGAVGLPTSATGVKVEDGVLWATTPAGVYAAVAEGGPVRFERFDDPNVRHEGISAGHVSALAVDGRGRVWAGMFDGGIDVLDPATGERAGRVDDPALHEINALVADAGGDRIWVASSRGLAVFDGERKTRTLGEQQGIAGGNVAALALGAGPDGTGVAVATNRGLSLVDASVARSLTAFHGLPNNHAYAVAVSGGRVWVGTLGGLAEVDALRVGRVYTTADSKLPHNWVNALAALDGRLYVGTYGGGVATLMPSGELVPAEETADLEVNPGAMAVVGRRLFVGTLDAGLWMLDVDAGRWTRVTAALSSLNVTALAADATYLYVGTEHGITRIERARLP